MNMFVLNIVAGWHHDDAVQSSEERVFSRVLILVECILLWSRLDLRVNLLEDLRVVQED